MLKVFNKQALTRNERFQRAILAGTATSLVFAVVYGVIAGNMRFEFSISFVAMGYGIGWAIRTYGRGVQVKFSILGAVCAMVCFLVADMIAIGGFEIFTSFRFLSMVFRFELMRLFALNISSLMLLMFRAVGVYFAYINSRIV